jgi:peptidyl-prolyl cis-trans isomerase B (cyclophilin B)
MNAILKNTLSLLFLLPFLGCNQKEVSATPEDSKRQQIELTTNYGRMIIELYDETPLHRDNFVNLVKNKAYDSLLFHRVINTFMIQGGDPDSKYAQPNDTLGEGDVPYSVKAEFNKALFHKKGVIAAARDNNPERASSGMQFYIVQGKVFNDSLLNKVEDFINTNKAKIYFKNSNDMKPLLDSITEYRKKENIDRYTILSDSLLILAKEDANFELYEIPEYQRDVYKTLGGTPHLDQNYTVFGEVIEGISVLDSIASVKTNALDRPLQDARIIQMKLVE